MKPPAGPSVVIELTGSRQLNPTTLGAVEDLGEGLGVDGALGLVLEWAEGAEVPTHAATISTSARAIGLICK